MNNNEILSVFVLLCVYIGLWVVAVLCLLYFIYFYFEYKADKKKYDNYFKEHPEQSTNPLNNIYYSSYETSKDMMKFTIKIVTFTLIPAVLMSLFI